MKHVYPFPKTCPCCGKVYTKADWDRLARLGRLTEMPWGEVCEYKNCQCGTTMMQSYTEDGKLQPNAAWVNRVLKENWDRILQRAGSESLMPVCERSKRGTITSCEEFGEGHYGAVYPTKTPGIVFKVTSDASEAFFVKAALELSAKDKYWPDGLVRYLSVYQVPETSHRNRPVFVLWRQEAKNIGCLTSPEKAARGLAMPPEYDYFKKSLIVLSWRVGEFKELAGRTRAQLRTSKDPAKRLIEAGRYEEWAWGQISEDDLALARTRRGSIFDHRYSGAQALALYIRGCYLVTEFMENEFLSDSIGSALKYYMDHGLLLADVHLNNIGTLPDSEGDGRHFAITDPGHSISIRPEPWDVRIEQV